MPSKVTLYPIYGIEDDLQAESPYGPPVLPAKVITDVAIEKVQALFDASTFAGVEEHFGKYALADVKGVQSALVHRYNTGAVGQDAHLDQQSRRLIRNLAAFLRLVRPMRQRAGLMSGELKNGALHLEFIEHQTPMEVPDLHRIFALRDGDINLFSARAGDFLAAMEGEFWKFRMAVEFHESGYFLPLWKGRYILWCSAIESLYTSESFQHRGSLVAKERIKWFLGAATSIYLPRDIPNFIPQANISLESILGDLYDIRNLIAHGSKIPDSYFQRKMRQGISGDLSVLDVVQEAASFIIRQSLLHILQKKLLADFADGQSAERYFGATNLTRAELQKMQMQKRP